MSDKLDFWHRTCERYRAARGARDENEAGRLRTILSNRHYLRECPHALAYLDWGYVLETIEQNAIARFDVPTITIGEGPHPAEGKVVTVDRERGHVTYSDPPPAPRAPNRAERRKAKRLTRKAVALIDAGKVTEAELLCVRQGLAPELVVAVLKRRAEILAKKGER